MANNYHTRSLRGTLLVIRDDSSDCVTIERDGMSRPAIVRVEGHWTAEELREAKKLWGGSEAQRF